MIQLIFCMVFLPVFAGLIPAGLKKKTNDLSFTEIYLLGLFVIFAVCELISCVLIKTGSGFATYFYLTAAGTGGLCLLSILLGWKTLIRAATGFRERIVSVFAADEARGLRLCALAAVLALLGMEIAGYFLYEPYTGSDVTEETVLVTTMTDTIFQYNPVLGTALKYGMYPIHKFASLPLLYSCLARAGGMEAAELVFVWIPIWMLLVGNGVVLLWGDQLFDGKREKSYLLLLLYHILILTGDGNVYSYGFGLLHSGFRGEILASGVAVPFLCYAGYELIVKKERIYGAVGMILALAGLLFTRPLFVPVSFLLTPEAERREWGMLFLASLALYLLRERIKLQRKKEIGILLLCFLLLGLGSDCMLPLLGISYVCVCIWEAVSYRKKGGVFLTGCILIICLTGTVIPFQSEARPVWRVEESEREILKRIETLAEAYKEKGQEAVLLAPDPIMERARMQNGYIKLPYGKDLWHQDCNREIADVYEEDVLLLYEQMHKDDLQPDAVAVLAAEQGCSILVLREEMNPQLMKRQGWRADGGVSGYTLYYKDH